MTYTELKHLCHKNEVAFRIALQTCMVQGLDTVRDKDFSINIGGNLFNDDFKAEINKAAKCIAETPSHVVLAIIQREMAPVSDGGETIPPLHEYGDEEGICPACGSEVEYNGDHHIDDEGTTVSWHCPECGATGKSGCKCAFTGHYDVCDEAGNPLPQRKSVIHDNMIF